MTRFFPLLVLVALAFSSRSFAVRYGYEIDKKFSSTHQELIKKWIGQAYQRLFGSIEIYNCIVRRARWEKLDEASVTRVHGEAALTSGTLFESQWTGFAGYIQNDGLLPKVTVLYTHNADTFAAGYAEYEKVYIAKDGPGNRWYGGFEITLNAAKINSSTDEDDWVSVIAHEMLHNLMHAHPSAADVGQEAAYSSDYIINAAQACIQTLGRNADFFPVAKCGGRRPKKK